MASRLTPQTLQMPLQCFFHKKVPNLVSQTQPKDTVYNGKNKLIIQNRNFMTNDDIKECMITLKSKRCEGYDKIPVCLVTEASDLLIEPLTILFEKFYSTGLIPEQWKVSKIIPTFKKGSKN